MEELSNGQFFLHKINIKKYMENTFMPKKRYLSQSIKRKLEEIEALEQAISGLAIIERKTSDLRETIEKNLKYKDRLKTLEFLFGICVFYICLSLFMLILSIISLLTFSRNLEDISISLLCLLTSFIFSLICHKLMDVEILSKLDDFFNRILDFCFGNVIHFFKSLKF
jgi:hypothetical protein